MFKKSRRKIVASLVCVLGAAVFGTVAVIYTASYVEVTGENRKMLRQYVEEYMFRDLSDASEAGSGWAGKYAPAGPGGAAHAGAVHIFIRLFCQKTERY